MSTRRSFLRNLGALALAPAGVLSPGAAPASGSFDLAPSSVPQPGRFYDVRAGDRIQGLQGVATGLLTARVLLGHDGRAVIQVSNGTEIAQHMRVVVSSSGEVAAYHAARINARQRDETPERAHVGPWTPVDGEEEAELGMPLGPGFLSVRVGLGHVWRLPGG